MVFESRSKEKITVSFSGKIEKKALNNIKNYIEFLEKASEVKRKEVPQTTINKLADEITRNAWRKLKEKRGLKF